MNKKDALDGLERYKDQLLTEVLGAYRERGSTYGNERFSAWRGKFTKFLTSYLPNETSKLNAKLNHVVYLSLGGESDEEQFWRVDGEVCISFIDSLVIDIKNDEYDFEKTPNIVAASRPSKAAPTLTKVFIVHGHDELTKTKTARFIEKLGYEAIILHEQASGGKTIIEKIEAYSDVGFAIVLYTSDDVGNDKAAAALGMLKNRARQNVVFEHGYLIHKLGRDKVVPLVVGDVEMPGDVSGIVYVTSTNWQIDIAKEMKLAGYEIDFNRLM